eukprot:5717067-Pyramimonas_sp.AAC.1
MIESAAARLCKEEAKAARLRWMDYADVASTKGAKGARDVIQDRDQGLDSVIAHCPDWLTLP